MAPSASSARRARRSAKRQEERVNVAAAEATAAIADDYQSEQVAKITVAEAPKDGGVEVRIMRIATPFRRRAQTDVADVPAQERWADVEIDADVPLDAPSFVGAGLNEARDIPLIADAVLTKAVLVAADAPAGATSQPEPSPTAGAIAVSALQPEAPVSRSHRCHPEAPPRATSQSEPSLSAPSSSPKLAPWETPVDGAAVAPESSYRNKLRAGGQQAFQRALAHGMLPKSSQFCGAGSMTPAVAPMLPLGALSQCSTGPFCAASPVSGMMSMAGTMTPQPHGKYCMPHSQYPPMPPPYHIPQQMCWNQPVVSPAFAPPTMAPAFGYAGNSR